MLQWHFEKLQGLYTVRQFEFHPLQKCVLFSTHMGEVCRIDMQTKQETYIGHVGKTRNDEIICLAWNRIRSPQEADIFYSGSKYGKLCATNTTTSEAVIQEFEEFGPSVHCLGVSADNSRLAVCGDSKSVKLYDTTTGKAIHTLKDIHNRILNSTKFCNQSPNLFVTASYDGTVKLWDTRSALQTPIRTIDTDTQIITLNISSDDERVLIAGLETYIQQFSLSDGQMLVNHHAVTFHRYERSYSRAYYSASNRYVYSITNDNIVSLSDASTGELLNTIHVHLPNVPVDGIQTIRGHPTKDEEFCIITIGPNGPTDLVHAKPSLLHPSTSPSQSNNQETTLISTSSAAPIASQEHQSTISPTEAMEKQLTELCKVSDCDAMIDQLTTWTAQARATKDALVKKELDRLAVLQENSLCAICQMEKKCMVCIPCGHVCLCQLCCNTLTFTTERDGTIGTKKIPCPLCATTVTQTMKIFL